MGILSAPAPSRYTKHDVVEKVASECAKLYMDAKDPRNPTLPIEALGFADIQLAASILWEQMTDGAFASVFAKMGRPEGRLTITINEAHRELFEARPDILRSSVGHEIGHLVLGHLDWNCTFTEDLLFPDAQRPAVVFLHDTSWTPLAFTPDEVSEWCRRASRGDDAARRKLEGLSDRMEPEWMFHQAEHFSMCFLVPRNLLMECLNAGWGVADWPAIYRLAEHFGVSPSLMRARLKRLGLISLQGREIRLGEAMKQQRLF